MKINWGTSIVIAFALFISFILYFIIEVQSNSKYDNELVIEEYYKHDAHYSDRLAEMQNAQDLPMKPIIANSAKGIQITFPKAVFPNIVEGRIALYRPSSKKLDIDMPFRISDSVVLFPVSDFAAGKWNFTLSWKHDAKSYIIEKKIYLK